MEPSQGRKGPLSAGVGRITYIWVCYARLASDMLGSTGQRGDNRPLQAIAAAGACYCIHATASGESLQDHLRLFKALDTMCHRLSLVAWMHVG